MGRDGERLRRAFQLCLEAAQAHYEGRGPQHKRGHPWVYGWGKCWPSLPSLPEGHLPGDSNHL